MTLRAAQATEAIARFGWAGASRVAMAGDASARRYERLSLDGQSAILMDAPAGTGDDPADFVAIARHLRAIGLNAPDILQADLAKGFLLIEDFGDARFTDVLAATPAQEPELYALAADVLVHLQSRAAPAGLSDLRADQWAEAAALVYDHYSPDRDASARADLAASLASLIRDHADGPRVMILRDYHAENLMWLADRKGLARAGLLDFQLAQMGQPGYDLVSLLQDARRDVSPATETACRARFCAARGLDPNDFAVAYAVLGAQRALRILGVFARLVLQDGKTRYAGMVPRVWGQLQRNLGHEALATLRPLCKVLVPFPQASRLARVLA